MKYSLLIETEQKFKITNYVYFNSWDTTKPENYYWMDGNRRTLAENKDLANKSNNNYGCIRSALLKIPIEDVRVDELHLLLRVADRLEKNILNNAIEKDKKDNLNKAPSARKHKTMQKTKRRLTVVGCALVYGRSAKLMERQVACTIGQAWLGMRRKKCSEAFPISSQRSLIQNTVIQSPKYGRVLTMYTKHYQLGSQVKIA